MLKRMLNKLLFERQENLKEQSYSSRIEDVNSELINFITSHNLPDPLRVLWLFAKLDISNYTWDAFLEDMAKDGSVINTLLRQTGGKTPTDIKNHNFHYGEYNTSKLIKQYWPTLFNSLWPTNVDFMGESVIKMFKRPENVTEFYNNDFSTIFIKIYKKILQKVGSKKIAPILQYISDGFNVDKPVFSMGMLLSLYDQIQQLGGKSIRFYKNIDQKQKTDMNKKDPKQVGSLILYILDKV